MFKEIGGQFKASCFRTARQTLELIFLPPLPASTDEGEVW